MVDYSIDKKYLRTISYSALGNQNKYFKDNYWYKENVYGYEGKAEFLGSIIMQHSNIEEYVLYEECMINGRKGCRSKNFLHEDDEFITFQKLYDYAVGGKLSDRIYRYTDVKERIEFVLDFIYQRTNLDCREYLQKVLALDMLMLNPDRHFHNLGVIKNQDSFRLAPVFDNGAALFSNFSIFPPYYDFEECKEKIGSAPFSGSLEQQAIIAGIELKLDYKSIDTLLNLHTDQSRATSILKRQLDTYKNIIPEWKKHRISITKDISKDKKGR